MGWEPLNRVVQQAIAGANVVAEDGLMKLGAAGEHGGNHGDSHASAYVAGQIDEAGGGVVLLPGQKCVRGRVDGNEKEGEGQGLKHAREGDGAEIYEGIEARHVKERKRKQNEAE